MTKQQRFWVIGGQYTCMGFEALRDGSAQIEGPFPSIEAAREAWKRLSREHSCHASTRFSIASEALLTPQSA